MQQQTNQYDVIVKILDGLGAKQSLQAITNDIDFSSSQLQQLVSNWAGVPVEQLIEYASTAYIQQLLNDAQPTLFDAVNKNRNTNNTLIHGSSITIEGMNDKESFNGGERLTISYSTADSPFGLILVASTTKGICHVAFEENKQQGFGNLQQRFPNATYHEATDINHQKALCFFQTDIKKLTNVTLHIKATPFQLNVWQQLLQISLGKLETYGSIAHAIHNPKASRAVGTAIGSNPVAFLIPCHRVVPLSGKVGGYMWGTTRKKAMIAWEASRVNKVY